MIEPARAAFLLIDMQNGFIDGASPLCIAGAAATVPACAHALAAAREHGLAVFHVRRAYAADGSDVEAVRWEAWAEGGRPLSSADPMSLACPPELAPAPGEPVVVKPSWSAFFGTDLDVLLRTAGHRHPRARGHHHPQLRALDGLRRAGARLQRRRPAGRHLLAQPRSTGGESGGHGGRGHPAHPHRRLRGQRASARPRHRGRGGPGRGPGAGGERRRGTRETDAAAEYGEPRNELGGSACPLPRRSSPSRPSPPAGSTSTTCTTRCPTGAPTPTRASPARGPSATRPLWRP